MRIYNKTLCIGIISLILLDLFFILTSNFYLLHRFNQMETQLNEKTMQGLSNAFEYERKDVVSIAKDLGIWDDMYDYVQRKDKAFIHSNFPPDTFESMNFDYVAVFNESGARLFAVGKNGLQTPLPTFCRKSNPDFAKKVADRKLTLSGFVNESGRIFVVGIQGIRKSSQHSNPSGYVIVARLIAKDEMAGIAGIARQNVRFVSLNEYRAAVRQQKDPLLAAAASHVYVPGKGKTVEGYAAIKDINGKQVAAYSTHIEASYSSQGEYTVRFFIILINLAGFLIGLGGLYMLDRFVLGRISGLTQEVNEISYGTRERIVMLSHDKDEIAVLTDSINEMLGIIQTKNNELAETGRQLNAAKEAAENANRAKTQFLANTTHEIKTPLNGILGMCGLLRKSGLSPKQGYYLEMLDYSGKILRDLLNDVLDYAKIEAGKVEIMIQPYDPRGMLNSLFELYAPKAREKCCILLIDVGQDVPGNIFGDVLRTTQIISNFLDNAIRHSENGQVSVFVDTVPDNDNDMQLLRCRVIDTGDDNNVDKIKRVLYDKQNPAEAGLQIRGTGLGLVICRELVFRMQGTIVVENNISQPGLLFTITIPIPRIRRHAQQHTPEGYHMLRNSSIDSAEVNRQLEDSVQKTLSVSGCILLVEDNIINLELLSTILTGRYEVESALSGEEALALPSREYVLAIIDYDLPGMNGLEVIAAFRDKGMPGPVAILTADDSPALEKRCVQVGASFITKPIDVEVFLSQIEEIIAANQCLPDEDGTDILENFSEFLADVGDYSLAEGLYEKFFVRWQTINMEAIISSVIEKDSMQLEKQLHLLKGTSGNLQMRRISERSAEIYNVIRGGGEIQEVSGDLKKLCNYIDSCMNMWSSHKMERG